MGSLRSFATPLDAAKLNRFCHRRKGPFLTQRFCQEVIGPKCWTALRVDAAAQTLQTATVSGLKPD